jgi:hypothetical protein
MTCVNDEFFNYENVSTTLLRTVSSSVERNKWLHTPHIKVCVAKELSTTQRRFQGSDGRSLKKINHLHLLMHA